MTLASVGRPRRRGVSPVARPSEGAPPWGGQWTAVVCRTITGAAHGPYIGLRVGVAALPMTPTPWTAVARWSVTGASCGPWATGWVSLPPPITPASAGRPRGRDVASLGDGAVPCGQGTTVSSAAVAGATSVPSTPGQAPPPRP